MTRVRVAVAVIFITILVILVWLSISSGPSQSQTQSEATHSDGHRRTLDDAGSTPPVLFKLGTDRIDFGRFPVGSKLSQSIQVTNATDKAIVFSTGMTTCGCVKAIEIPETIPARGVANVPITLDASQKRGDIRQTITFVATQGNEKYHTSLSIVGLSAQHIEFSPLSIDFSDIPASGTTVQSINLRAGMATTDVPIVSFPSRLVMDYGVFTLRPGGSQSMNVSDTPARFLVTCPPLNSVVCTFDAANMLGPLQLPLHFEIKCDGRESVETVIAHGNIVDPRISPSVIRFGLVNYKSEDAENTEQFINVSSVDSSDIRDCTILAPDWIKTEKKYVSAERLVKFRLRPDRNKISTSGFTESRVEVSYKSGSKVVSRKLAATLLAIGVDSRR